MSNYIYKDRIYKIENFVSLIFAYIGVFISLGLIIGFTYTIINISQLDVSFFFFIGLFFAILYFIHALSMIIEGPRIIYDLTFYNGYLKVTNLVKQTINIDNNELKLIKTGNQNWFLWPYPEFKSDKPSLTIHLYNGCFYRISPNMERIEELQNTLGEIIENQQL